MNLIDEDFYGKVTTNPIKITVTFTDLSDQAKIDLKDYVRQDKLVVCAMAEWNPIERIATVVQHGFRAGMKDFAPYFKALNDNRPVKDLLEIYAVIQGKYSDLKAGKTKAAMTDALRAFEDAHPEQCVLLKAPTSFTASPKAQTDWRNISSGYSCRQSKTPSPNRPKERTRPWGVCCKEPFAQK